MPVFHPAIGNRPIPAKVHALDHRPRSFQNGGGFIEPGPNLVLDYKEAEVIGHRDAQALYLATRAQIG